MPTPRELGGIAVLDHKIYIFGGKGKFISGKGQPILSTLEIYDTETDTWTTGRSMLRATSNFATAVVDGKIYAIGGKDPDNYSYVCNTVQIYNPSTDSWRSGASMPVGRQDISGSVLNGKIYLIGGYESGGNRSNQTFIYDTVKNSCSTAPFVFEAGRANVGSTVINGKLYAVGGIEMSGKSHDTVETVQIGESVPDPEPEPEPEPTPYQLAVNLQAGQQIQLGVTSDQADNASVAWTSSDETVATVDSSGKVTAMAEGLCTITVKDAASFQQTVSIRVLQGSDVVTEKVNDDSSRITYSGNWTPYAGDPAFYHSDEHFSNQSGAYAEFTFTCTGVNLIAATSNNLGICDVYVDGQLQEQGMDLYSSALEAQKVLFSKTDLVNDQHTIKVVVTGAKNSNASDAYVTIDAFEVLQKM